MVLSKNLKMAAVALVVVLAAGLYSMMGYSNPAKMNESTASVTHIGPNDFTNAVIASTKPVVVDFYATWCGPCKILSPMLDGMAPLYTNSVTFVKVNIDEAPGLAKGYDIEGIPTLLMFRDGKVVDRTLGVPPQLDLKMRLDLLAKGK